MSWRALNATGKRDVFTDVLESVIPLCSLTGTDEVLNLRERARGGDPFPLIAYQWPNLLIEPDDEDAKYFDGEPGNPENPCLRLDRWQRDEIISPFFDDSVYEICVKGCTGPGKGASVSICTNLWFDVFDPSKTVLSSSDFNHAKRNIYAETVKWRNMMTEPAAASVLTSEIKDASQHYVVVSNPATGEGFCHDDQTEVLSARGWITFEQLLVGEEVLTMDPNTKESIYLPVQDVSRSFYKGEMIRSNQKGLDFCVTPKHRMFADAARGLGLYKFVEAGSMDTSRAYMERNVKWKGERQETYSIHGIEREVPMDDWLRFLGFYMGRGMRENGNTLSVIPKRTCDTGKLNASMAALGFQYSPWSFQITDSNVARDLYQLDANSAHRRVPPFVRYLSAEQIRLFVESFASGSGFRNRKGRWSVYNRDRVLLGDIQELGLKAGFQCFLCPRDKNMHVLTMSPSCERIRYDSRKSERIQYEGMIYCATVESGLLFTRRNGKTLWSGNSGQHSPHTLFVLDEATSISGERYLDACKQARKIAIIGNPRVVSGWFFRLWEPCGLSRDTTQTVLGHMGRRHCVTVGGMDCLNVRENRLKRLIAPPGGIEIDGEEYEESSRIPKRLYSKIKPLIPAQCDLAQYRGIRSHPDPRHVAVFADGKFPDEDPESQVILPSWLPRHVEAWNAARGRILVDCFGFDVGASQKGDRSVLAAGSDEGCAGIHDWQGENVLDHADRIIEIASSVYGIDLREGQVPVVVDEVGVGKGTSQELARQGVYVICFNGGLPSQVREYLNLRAESYAILGRRLSPRDSWKDRTWALPDDSDLLWELSAPEKKYPGGGDGLRWKLEPKDEVKKKVGRSPDKGDAVVMLHWGVLVVSDWFDPTRELATVVEDPDLTEDELSEMSPEVRELYEFYDEEQSSQRIRARSPWDEVGGEFQ